MNFLSERNSLGVSHLLIWAPFLILFLLEDDEILWINLDFLVISIARTNYFSLLLTRISWASC